MKISKWDCWGSYVYTTKLYALTYAYMASGVSRDELMTYQRFLMPHLSIYSNKEAVSNSNKVVTESSV